MCHANPTSSYRGVSYQVSGRNTTKLRKWPWVARIYHQGRQDFLGRFATDTEAAKAYDQAVIKRGLSRQLNLLKPKLND